MKLRFSSHAQIRMDERGISTDKIKEVISSPDSSVNKHSGRVESKKMIDGRTITVIYKKEKTTFVIITTI